MKFHDYCKDRVVMMMIHLAGLLVLSLFLLLTGNSKETVILIAVVWLVVVMIYMLVDYERRSHYFKELMALLDGLEKRYLVGELMKTSGRLEDQLYREILRKSNKSVVEKIYEMEERQKEYREYIEQWIHEVKTPITAAKLICENHKDTYTERLLTELGEIEDEVEKALYYARMEHAYQDYLIHPVDLKEVVLSVIHTQKRYLVQSGMQIAFEMEKLIVSTDEKWVAFLLKQIFSNCMKYRREQGGRIHIYTEEGERQKSLMIEDNGCGIAAEDLPRIFDKGFTGKNGRDQHAGTATGLGLYLCRGLCDKLGAGIACVSSPGEYTRIMLTFPYSEHNKIDE